MRDKMSTTDKKNNFVLGAFMEIKSALAASIARVIVRPEDVEDVLQQTYMLVCSQSYKTEIKSVKGYFFKVARNVALKDVARRTKARINSLDDITTFEPSSDEAGADDKLHYTMKLESFMEVAKSLPTKCRQAFLLKKVMGLSQKEVARKMNIAESTVEKHLIAAMRRTVSEMKSKGYSVGADQKLVELKTRVKKTDERQTGATKRI
ncbi:hypothetical protein MNBD_ALPHA02-1316 [hydrothermal vent metagenome]|uniref:RNA polymerase sigma factor 70 region 4 type 2 domain-containing protein n=1 Tax=hydrothermal vent metagenome TaxID=652676 RepID=A0A3B0SSW6_9ZZZZ